MSASYAANDQQVIANAVAQIRGKTGTPKIFNYGSPSPQYPISAIYCIQDCLFFSLTIYANENDSKYSAGQNKELVVSTSSEDGNVSSVIFPAGSLIKANIYSFVLDSGQLIAYPA